MKVLIELTQGELPYVIFENEGVERSFEVNHDDLFEVIKKSCYKEVKKEVLKPKFVSPDLPRGTTKYSERTDGASIITIAQPPSVQPITFEKTTFQSVPTPPLLLTFVVKNKKLLSGYILAYKDQVIHAEMPLYVFPFSNVHANNGSLCYYGNEIVHETLSQFERWFHQWIRIPFNNHLYDAYTNKAQRTKRNVPLRELLASLDGKEAFPLDELVETKWTYESFIKNIYGEES